jgi:hypothetical protein
MLLHSRATVIHRMATNVSHWIDVRDKPGFLHRLMSELAGRARMSLEGDLSKCHFTDDHVVARDEDLVLKRSTLSPRLGFVILKLEPEAVAALFKQVIAAGLKKNIIHVQIERNGSLQLGAYDNFHPDCVVTGPEVSAELLEKMKISGVVRSFGLADGGG